MPYGNDTVGHNNINTMRMSDLKGNVVNGGYRNFNPTDPASGLLQTSTNIFIYANGGIVGMIQSFRVSESRNVTKLNAIGYEGVVQAVPGNTTGGQLDVTRIALYNSNLWQALGLTTDGAPYTGIGSKVHQTGFTDNVDYGPAPTGGAPFRTLRDQRVPFEIVVKTPMDGNGTRFYEERYVDCWLASYSKSYSVSGEITVAENATIRYGDVY